MSLIARKEKEETKVVPVRLPMSVIELLDAYGQHVNGDRGYVVAEALKIVFSQDREFAELHGLVRERRGKQVAGV